MLALKSDGTVHSWGWNAYGQLGDGSSTERLTPVEVSGLTGVIAINSGFNHSMSLGSDGRLRLW